jgi:hypothetical protein
VPVGIVRLDDVLKGEDHVVRCKGFSVRPSDALAQMERECLLILGNVVTFGERIGDVPGP